MDTTGLIRFALDNFPSKKWLGDAGAIQIMAYPSSISFILSDEEHEKWTKEFYATVSAAKKGDKIKLVWDKV